MSNRFLVSDALWRTLTEGVKCCGNVRAAIAYFGHGGSNLMPLKAGHRLVVDLSEGAVRNGNTNPFEIENLLKRGVNVFTRKGLHAKFVIYDRSLIVSSANVSSRSNLLLDEAGLLTNDPVSIQQASRHFERLCTTPVRPKYLRECKTLYKPPRFATGISEKNNRHQRILEPKLRIVSLISASLPDFLSEHMEAGIKYAKKLTLKNEGNLACKPRKERRLKGIVIDQRS